MDGWMDGWMDGCRVGVEGMKGCAVSFTMIL
jgi:hypothetical protein